MGVGSPMKRRASVDDLETRRVKESFNVDLDSDYDATGSDHSSDSEADSLFDEAPSQDEPPLLSTAHLDAVPAARTSPPIPGFFFDPTLRLPEHLADSVVSHCLATYFTAPHIDQIMLFCRAGTPERPPSGLPPVFLALLDSLCGILKPFLPPDAHDLLFPTTTTLARQAIINKYEPGEGITPHVDLLKRFGDGIIGVSFCSGCVMQFASEAEKKTYGLYLPGRSIIVMTGDARYKWTHGIERQRADYVFGEESGSRARLLERSMRLSITFRWLLPGADILS